jgi:hypothetical protein
VEAVDDVEGERDRDGEDHDDERPGAHRRRSTSAPG